MREELEPNEATRVTLLPFCVGSRTIDFGHWIDSYAEASGLFNESIYVGNAVIYFHYKCRRMKTAALKHKGNAAEKCDFLEGDDGFPW